MRIMDYGAITQVGVVIVFEEGVSIDEAKRLVERRLGEALDPKFPPQAGKFDPRYGQPVFYVP